ncbi:MAG: pectate lyase [Thermoguttaceae bacterium]
MNRPIAAAVALFGLLASFVAPVRAEVTAEQVRRAIHRGVSYLLAQQRDDGAWPEMSGYRGGVGALCTLALLNAGVEANDRRMQKALNYLRTIPPEKTYVVALQTMVFARAEPDRDRKLILRNVEWLEGTQVVKGPFKGAWTYPDNRG